MNAELFSESVRYERLTQAIYQAILRQEGSTVKVEHDVDLPGRSGVKHQVDVFWEFCLGGVQHRVLIECKNYESSVTLEKVRNFFAVLHDVGNCQGVMVTRTGYQSGVEQFAAYYGIDLKLLREPHPEDWAGRIKDLHLNLRFRGVVSTADKYPKVFVHFRYQDEAQEQRIKALHEAGTLAAGNPPQLVFWDRTRTNPTEELRWWLPKQLQVLEKEDGGPYRQTIEMVDKFIVVNEQLPSAELVQVSHLEVEYFVETIEDRDVVLRGEEIVEAILKDVRSGAVQYVKRKDESTPQ